MPPSRDKPRRHDLVETACPPPKPPATGSDHRDRILFVTGRLAEHSLREVVDRLVVTLGFDAELSVQKISVAALLTVDWLLGKLTLSRGTDRVILPGYCAGDLERLKAALGGVPVERGPKDLHELPAFFRQTASAPRDYGRHAIEILAEINHADQRPPADTLAEAERLKRDGADVIDLGTTPGGRWREIGTVTRELIARGLRVSVDSFDPGEVEDATRAGAELVLSVHRGNAENAKNWGTEVVVVPERPEDEDWLDQLEQAASTLERDQVRHRLDPILEPIGFGFARSLGRYLSARGRFPNASMMMGIGNLTELTEVDSAGVNALLVGFCAELSVGSVLTTEVIPWARSSVREVVAARELMDYAVRNHALPKHVDSRLVMLRDAKIFEHGRDALERLQRSIKDANFRLFAEEGEIVAVNRDLLERSSDPFDLFARLGVDEPSHAFYLGWEMMKASLALQLGKQYVQDEALRWGLLSVEETKHRRKRERKGHRREKGPRSP